MELPSATIDGLFHSRRLTSMPLHIPTPLVPSRHLSQLCGHSIWLKLGAVQPPGSFKIRGVGHACEEYVKRGARRLVSSSGGNAGLAVAYAGRRLLVEPACGASLAVVYERSPALAAFKTIVVVCGGATATVDHIRQWAKASA